jgi:hypothetical protein
MLGYSWEFIIGMTLLLTNQFVGLGGLALCTYLRKRTGKKSYYAVGTSVYILSWIMLIIGVSLAGPQGIAYLKRFITVYHWQAVVGALLILAVVIYVWEKNHNIEKTGSCDQPR